MWETEGYDQSLFSGLWGLDKGKCPYTGTEEIPHQYAKELLHDEGEGAQKQVV